MFTYDRFEPGACYGTFDFRLMPDLVSRWCSVFPEDAPGPFMPPGMTAVVTMRAYNALISPRPPGNIHGSQRFEMHFLPRVGSMLHTTIRCVDKQMRKERRVVRLAFDTREGSDVLAFSGLFTSLVAE